jgi:tetratricopeptide (TPR) repeat protein
LAISAGRKSRLANRIVLRAKKNGPRGRPRMRGRRHISSALRRDSGSVKPARSGDLASRRNGDAQFSAAVKNFEAAVRHFHRRNYEKAAEIFEKLGASAPVGIADRAKVHLHWCEQRLAQSSRPLKTAEDFYVAGVSGLNTRHLETAIACLSKAVKMDPKCEEAHYALAAAHAQHGNTEAAIEHLRISIQLRPQNAFQARTDEDMRPLASDLRFHGLVHRIPGAARSTS